MPDPISSSDGSEKHTTSARSGSDSKPVRVLQAALRMIRQYPSLLARATGMLVSLIVFLLCLLYLGPLSVSELPPELREYLDLPIHDLRTEAEALWSQGERDSALSLLEYIIDNDLPDAPAAREDYRRFLEALASDHSLLGRAAAFGRGAVLGNVDSLDSLAGSTVADFFVIGDVRDLVVQSFSADPDEFILALSTIGLASTLWPPADPVSSALKTGKKSGALSKPFEKQLLTIAKLVSRSTDKVAALRGAFEPVWTLTKKRGQAQGAREPRRLFRYLPVVNVGSTAFLISEWTSLGLSWGEIEDGDLTAVKYLVARRGDDARSDCTVNLLQVLSNEPRVSVIPLCPQIISAGYGFSPVGMKELRRLGAEPLYVFKKDKPGSQVRAQPSFSSSKDHIRFDNPWSQWLSSTESIEPGDYVMTGDGRFVGVMVSKDDCYVLPVTESELRSTVDIPIDRQARFKGFIEGVKKVKQR